MQLKLVENAERTAKMWQMMVLVMKRNLKVRRFHTPGI
ncbi:uncharacterized protein J3R85_018835 [Psidium guajava]|nr:uncharacterized protein J3R85_018835 [Psidium guajava]